MRSAIALTWLACMCMCTCDGSGNRDASALRGGSVEHTVTIRVLRPDGATWSPQATPTAGDRFERTPSSLAFSVWRALGVESGEPYGKLQRHVIRNDRLRVDDAHGTRSVRVDADEFVDAVALVPGYALVEARSTPEARRQLGGAVHVLDLVLCAESRVHALDIELDSSHTELGRPLAHASLASPRFALPLWSGALRPSVDSVTARMRIWLPPGEYIASARPQPLPFCGSSPPSPHSTVEPVARLTVGSIGPTRWRPARAAGVEVRPLVRVDGEALRFGTSARFKDTGWVARGTEQEWCFVELIPRTGADRRPIALSWTWMAMGAGVPSPVLPLSAFNARPLQRVAPGDYELRVRGPGIAPQRQLLTAIEGTSLELTIVAQRR